MGVHMDNSCSLFIGVSPPSNALLVAFICLAHRPGGHIKHVLNLGLEAGTLSHASRLSDP